MLGMRDQKRENKQLEPLQKPFISSSLPQVHDFGTISDGGNLHNERDNQQVQAETR